MIASVLTWIISVFAGARGYELYDPDSREELLLIPSSDEPDVVVPEETVRPRKRLPITADLLPVNRYSRSGGRLMSSPKAVVVHWVAGPRATAKGIRDYFAGLKGRYASTHFVVGLEGEVIRMIPEDEVAYHVGAHRYMPGIYEMYAASAGARTPNYTTLGIECCHLDWSGRMTAKTLESLEHLCTDLLLRHHLESEDLKLHHDFTGKKCHRWFVDRPSEWAAFRARVSTRMGETA